MPIFISFLLSPLLAYAISADKIVERADHGRMPEGLVAFTATVQDFEKGEKVRETKYKAHNKSREASLVETVSPERQRGRKLLMEGTNLWFYTPDIRRAARVSMQQKLTGEIANGDLLRTNFYGDYDATLVGSEKIDGKDAYRLSLKASREGVTYSKLDYWVSKGDFLPMKAVFYAVSGKVLKTGTFSEPKTVFGKPRITKFWVKDFIDPRKQSILIYSDYKRVKSAGNLFTKESLSE